MKLQEGDVAGSTDLRAKLIVLLLVALLASRGPTLSVARKVDWSRAATFTPDWLRKSHKKDLLGFK
jgi:hypothetical protein